MKTISSTQNPFIKQIAKLYEKSSERKKKSLFVVEGKREVLLALEGNYEFEQIIICPEIYTEDSFSIELKDACEEIIEVTKAVYEKIAYRKSTEGIMGIAKYKSHSLQDIKLSNNPLILVAEGIEKPGNLGALLRTADAAKVDAVFLADGKCDLYNPNVIRSSIGCVFTNQIVAGSTEELIDFLNQNNISIYAATLQNSNTYTKENYSYPTAIAVGSEANGISKPWRETSRKNINIPMQGIIDSMNVSVSAAILIFEAKRQRNFK